MSIGCVLLNYNDAETTLSQVKRIQDYECFRCIVVVDNASTDDSWQKLKRLEGTRIHTIRANRNGGYGAGNNLGIRYCSRKLGLTHVVVANPDTEFSNECVKGLERVFSRYSKVGAAAAVMRQENGAGDANRKSCCPSCWPLLPWLWDLLDTGPVCRRLFKQILGYSSDYAEGQEVVPVGAVHGSMLMVDVEKMLDCGGYDEKLFLYGEEKTLGARMKRAGYQTVLLRSQSYLHAHSVSISKTYSSVLKRQRLLHNSKLYYYKTYLEIGWMQEIMTRIYFSFILGEIWFCNHSFPD